MKKIFSVFFFSLLFFALYSLLNPGTVFAYTLTCASPQVQTFPPGDIPFSGSLDDNDSPTIAGQRDIYFLLDGSPTWIDGWYRGASDPSVYRSWSGPQTVTSPGSHTWGIVINLNGSFYDSCPGSFTISSPPPVNLPANASFSGSPNGGTLDNPVTFSGTVSDIDPNPGTRTVTATLDDGTTLASGSYNQGGSFIASGSYTVPTPPYTNRSWTITVSMSGSTASQTYNFNITDPGALLLAPSNMQVICNGGGLRDPSGVEWCDEQGLTLKATVSTRNGEVPTFFNISGLPYTSSCNTISNDAANCTANPSGWLPSGVYNWTAWSSGTSGGSWSSPSNSSSFGVDTAFPTSNAGTPYLALEGSTWKIKWLSNGSDAESGIGRAYVGMTDNATGCGFSGYGLGPPLPSPTEKLFNYWCGGNLITEPVPGHTYTFDVQSCDYALHCGVASTGSYDGSLTPTYSIYGDVFIDYNGDGIRNTSFGFPPDTEYTGGDVQIYMNGTPGPYTNGFGSYVISDLPNGSYTLEAVPPAGYITVNKPAVGMPNPRTAFINNADSYGNDFAIWPPGGPPPTATPPPSNYPIIQSFRIYNHETPLTPYPGASAFSGTYGISGKKSEQQGLKWLNPMRIRIGAQLGPGVPLGTVISEIYVAFYEKSLYPSGPPANLALDDVIAKLNLEANRGKGFVLRTAVGGSYLRNNASTAWLTLATTNPVCIPTSTPACTGTPLFGAKKTTSNLFPPGAVYTEWVTYIYQESISKNYYTAVQVTDSGTRKTFINNYTNITQ